MIFREQEGNRLSSERRLESVLDPSRRIIRLPLPGRGEVDPL